MEAPALTFHGLSFFITRDDDHVTGRVEFPDESKPPVSIDYRNATTPPADAAPRSGKFELRKKVVDAFSRGRTDLAHGDKRGYLARIAASFDVSPRTVQLWVDKFEREGDEGLRDHYAQPRKKVVCVPSKRAADAVLICGWWAFRIANVESITHRMFALAAETLATGYSAADLVAVIDAYYSYDTDRVKFPFKTFEKFFTYELPKWVLRAAETNDLLRAKIAAKAPASTRTRRAQTNNHRTRSDIRSLDESRPHAVGATAVSAVPSVSVPSCLGGSSSIRSIVEDHSNRLQLAALPDAACNNANPETVGEALARLDNRYRGMLLRAAGSMKSTETRPAIDEAASTLPLWWDRMPTSVRNNIDFAVSAWVTQHPKSSRLAERRKVQLLLPLIRSRNNGMQRIGIANRLPSY